MKIMTDEIVPWVTEQACYLTKLAARSIFGCEVGKILFLYAHSPQIHPGFGPDSTIHGAQLKDNIISLYGSLIRNIIPIFMLLSLLVFII